MPAAGTNFFIFEPTIEEKKETVPPLIVKIDIFLFYWYNFLRQGKEKINQQKTKDKFSFYSLV